MPTGASELTSFHEEMPLSAVEFNNVCIGSERVLKFQHGDAEYLVKLREANQGLNVKAILSAKIGGCDALIHLRDIKDFGRWDPDNQEIDFMLFEESVRIQIFNAVFEKNIATVVAETGLEFVFNEIYFDPSKVEDHFSKTVGIYVVRNQKDVCTFNIRLNEDLLKVLNKKFLGLPGKKNKVNASIPFEWYITAGSTKLTQEEYSQLEEFDIIMLDDSSALQSGVYEVHGLEAMDIRGVLNGSVLTLQ